MRFALPPWEPSDPNCDHPFFGPVGRSPQPAITDLDNAYMAPRERGDRDGGLRKLSKRDEQIICRLIERELLNRKQCAQLFDVSEKTIAMIVYAAGLRFARKKSFTAANARVDSLKIKRIQKLLSEGKTTQEIASLARCSQTLVCQVRAGRAA